MPALHPVDRKSATPDFPHRHPRRPMICPIPLRRPVVLALLVADVLNAAKDREDLAAGTAVLRSQLTGEALAVAGAPVNDQLGQPRSVDGPTPRRPAWAGVAINKTV